MIDRLFTKNRNVSLLHAVLSIWGMLFAIVACIGCGEVFSTSKPPQTAEDIQTKNMLPPPGKALVYFYYGRFIAGGGAEVSLDGISSQIGKDRYIVWEVAPGEHTLEFLLKKVMSQKTMTSTLSCEPDQIYYYRLYSYTDKSQQSRGVTAYDIRRSKDSDGRKKIQEFSLTAWFRDGEAVFRRESETSPKEAPQEEQPPVAEASMETTEEPGTSQESSATPDTESPPEVVVPSIETTAAVSPEKQVPQTQSEVLSVQERYYALMIGISQYQYTPLLSSAVSDIQAVSNILREQYGFKVQTLCDQKATREGILDTLHVFQRLLEPQDKLLIYYAGHSYRDPDSQTAYWLPVNAKEDNTTQWLSTDTVTDSVKRIPASQIVIIADSEYSGKLVKARQTDLFDVSARQRYLERIGDTPARVLITSGAKQPILYGDEEISLFARAFSTALSDMGAGVFSAEELFAHVREIVAGQSEQLPEFSVIRNSGHEGGDFLFKHQK